jgi:L-rhamnose-H+ transport protein
LAGTLWYFQFFFYSMGETQMGEFKFSSWTLHMASIIIFSSIWGLALKEWKGASSKSKGLLYVGLGILVLSTCIIGYGNYIGSEGGH